MSSERLAGQGLRPKLGENGLCVNVDCSKVVSEWSFGVGRALCVKCGVGIGCEECGISCAVFVVGSPIIGETLDGPSVQSLVRRRFLCLASPFVDRFLAGGGIMADPLWT